MGLVQCATKEKGSTKLKSDVNLWIEYVDSSKYSLPGQDDISVNIYNLMAHVKNVSEDTIFVSSWSCSTEAQFRIDDTLNFSIIAFQTCYSNFPTIETIAPNESYKVRLKIKYKPRKDQFPFLIGFILNQHMKFLNFDAIKCQRIVWSKQINVK